MRKVDKDAVLRHSAGLQSELLDDELLLFHAERTRILALNSAASLIWSLCDGERRLCEVECLLMEAYPESSSEIPGDVEKAVSELMNEGALELEVSERA